MPRPLQRALAAVLGAIFGAFILAAAALADTNVVPNWPYVCRDHAAVFNIRIAQGEPGVDYPVRVKVGDAVFGPVSVQLNESKELLVYARGAYRIQVGNGPTYLYDEEGPDQIPCHDIQQPTNVAAQAPTGNTAAAKSDGHMQTVRQGMGPAPAPGTWSGSATSQNLLTIGIVLGFIDIVGWICYLSWSANWFRMPR